MLKLEMDPSLPRLAWIAENRFTERQVVVHYGRDVEVGETFLVEGVWDGPFEDLDFEKSAHFFGSGLKVQEDKLVVVPSTGLVDRIFVGECQDKFFVSNSLIEILARTGSELDPSHNYRIQTDTIRTGFRNYVKDYPISSQTLSSLKQFFYHPVAMAGRELTVITRGHDKTFENYDDYISTLVSDIKQISANASSSFREKPLQFYTTISKGYDSTAVSALIADVPVRKAFTTETSNSSLLGVLNRNWSDDDGSEIAQKLGLEVAYLDVTNEEIENDELYFLAATTGEPEIQLYKLHKHLETETNPSVAFTGYHGDTVWALHPPESALVDDIIKPGASGLTLSEARLVSGFIDVPVPMMYAQAIVSINKISTSAEMSAWSVGGDYDRPIPRRILESKGIPRHEFGMAKRAVATFYDVPKNRELKQSFLGYMKREHGITAGSISFNRLKDHSAYYLKRCGFALDQLTINSGKLFRPLDKHSIDTPYYMHIWSIARLVEDRKSVLRRNSDQRPS